MTYSVFMGPGSWASKRELEKRNRYVSLYKPGEVFVNHLEVERKQEQARLKQQRREEKAALRQAQRDEFVASIAAKKEERLQAKQIRQEQRTEAKAQREAQKAAQREARAEAKAQGASVFDKVRSFAQGLFASAAPQAESFESDYAVAQSLEDSAVEFDIERRDEMIEALKQGRYDEFRKSEFASMPLDELYALFDFEDYGYINEPEKIEAENMKRVIGKPKNIRKNKSLTLNYLRKNDVIDVKTLLELMKQEEFGTIRPNSADELLSWATHRDGIMACPRPTANIGHNRLLKDLQLEIRSAFESLHAPKNALNKILVFPNGEEREMLKFLTAAA